jgi:hypothetical protein
MKDKENDHEEDDEENEEDEENEDDEDEENEEDDEENEENGEDEENEEDEEDEEESIIATIPEFPIQIICMEYIDETFDYLITNNKLNEEEWFSAFMQIIMILITYQKVFSFTHNDLHTNNVMYTQTDKKYLYYLYKNKYYKVPTFGRIYKIIDFGRSIYKFDKKIFCSDSFQNGNDAATQYNTEPYFNDKKPRLDPNFSFDLCRLACSIFDYVVEDLDEIKDLKSCEKHVQLIVEWCLDDNNLNVLYKSNGAERYPDFKLYKMIARSVHKHIPEFQLERKEFSSYIISKNDMPKNKSIINIDEIPFEHSFY